MEQFITSVNTEQYNSYIPSSDLEEQINTPTTKPNHPCTVQRKQKVRDLKIQMIRNTLRAQGLVEPNTRTAEAMNVKTSHYISDISGLIMHQYYKNVTLTHKIRTTT